MFARGGADGARGGMGERASLREARRSQGQARMGIERGGRMLGGAGEGEGFFGWKGRGAGRGDAAVALAGGTAGAGLGGRGR